MLRPRLLPNTSTWKQLRSVEFGMAAALCTEHGRGYPVKSFKSVRGRQSVDTATVGAPVPSAKPKFCFLIGAGPLTAFYVRVIWPLLIIRQFTPAAPRLTPPLYLV